MGMDISGGYRKGILSYRRYLGLGEWFGGGVRALWQGGLGQKLANGRLYINLVVAYGRYVLIQPGIDVEIGRQPFGVDEATERAATFKVIRVEVILFGLLSVIVQADDGGLPTAVLPHYLSITGPDIAIARRAHRAHVDDVGVIYSAEEGAMGVSGAENGWSGGDLLAEFVSGGIREEAVAVTTHGSVADANLARIRRGKAEVGRELADVGDLAVELLICPIGELVEFVWSNWVGMVSQDVAFVIAVGDVPGGRFLFLHHKTQTLH